MEIIRINNSRYDEYEKLLLRREQYSKDAQRYLGLYIHEFGDLMTAVFKEKIACIEKKKMLSFCMMYINRGEHIDENVMRQYIQKEMANYQKQLDKLIHDNEACKKLGYIPEKDNVIFSRLMDAGKLLSANIIEIKKKSTDYYQVNIGIYLVDF
jgi:hypothetical protein